MPKRIVGPQRLAGFIAFTTLLVACGGSDSGPVAPPPPSIVLTNVQLSAAATELFTSSPGNTTTLNVTATDQNGAVMNPTSTSFSSDNGAVATVSAAGIVTAVGAGTVRITAAATVGAATRSGSISITAVAPPAAAQVNAPALAFEPGVVHIAAGGAVTWNVLNIHHTVTFATPGAPASTGELRDASASRTFATRGSFYYACDFHAGMTGIVHVH